MTLFNEAHPKIIKSTLSFPEFVTACTKSVYSISSSLRYDQFLTIPTQKTSDQLLIFVKLHQHVKSLFYLFILQIQSIIESCNQISLTHFLLFPPKNFQSPFNLSKFVPACKKSVNSTCSFLRYTQFQIPKTRLGTPIFDYAQPKYREIFDELLIFVNLYQQAKNEAVSSICSAELVNLKMLQSREQNFSQIWDLCKNTGNNINCHHRIQKILFLAQFPQWGKKCFSKKFGFHMGF